MKSKKIMTFIFASLFFFACNSSTDFDALKEDPNIEHHSKVETPDDWKTFSTNSYFSIDHPSKLLAREDLNNSASCQYGYVNSESGEELYMIVILETKEEIKSYDLDQDFDAISYGNLSVEKLQEGLSSYNMITKEPKIAEVNGISCVEYEMEGYLDELGIFYYLGIFEGRNAFYQVLTWTLLDNKDQFRQEMQQMIYSFSEK